VSVALFPVPIVAVTACISITKNEKSYAIQLFLRSYFAEDMEMVQVFIAPRKENLEHVVEVRQSRVAVDQKAPPDERTNVS
jgi:hypothetical protein